MFSIEATYTDNHGNTQTTVVYDDTVTDKRYSVVDPVLDLEDNSAGSLSFTLYQNNAAYGHLEELPTDPLHLMTTTIRVFMDTSSRYGISSSEEIWEGRPLTMEKDFYNGKNVYCEGAFCYLNDIDLPFVELTADRIQNDYTFGNKKSVAGGYLEIIDFFKVVLTEYNKRAADNRKFYVDGTYVNPIRIPIGYNFKGCMSDYYAIKHSQNPHERDIYQTMTGLSGYRNRGYVDDVDTLDSLESPAANDICYVLNDDYYLYDGASWAKTRVMDYVGEYYVYAPDPKSTRSQMTYVWTNVTTQIHVSCGIFRRIGGESAKNAISSLISDFGGHIKVRTVDGHRCLYYTAKIYPENAYVGVSNTLAPQSVDFGKNLMDLTRKRDGSEFFTVLLPVGAEISKEHPETIESMCTNVIANGEDVKIFPYHTDLTLDTRAQPFDATQQLFLTSTGRNIPDHMVPRRVFAKHGLDPGYTYYLFTTSYNQDTAADSAIQNNTYMCLIYDEGPNRPALKNADDPEISQGSVAYPYYISPLSTGETYSVTDKATYSNNRLLWTSRLPVSDTLTSMVGQELNIPPTGTANGYALYFSSAILYSRYRVTAGENEGRSIELPSDLSPGNWSWDNKVLDYPRLYKSPYSERETHQRNVRKVDDHYILWAGCTKYGGVQRNDIDPHKLDRQYCTDKYGTDNWCFHFAQNSYIKLLQYSNTGRSSWHVPLPESQWSGSMWNTNVNDNWAFSTGEAGYHVARVIVEPGKKYYLNTRVTNPGYPKEGTYAEVNTQEDLYNLTPYAWDMAYVRDEQVYYIYDPNGGWYTHVDWIPDPNKTKRYMYLDELGEMKYGREYKESGSKRIAWAVVACRPVYAQGSSETISWGYQVVLTGRIDESQQATCLNMQEIQIPRAIPPDQEKPLETLHFYDPITGNTDTSVLDQTVHLELWFACDQCYINGNGEYDQETHELVGYVPEVYVEDETAYGNEGGINYKACVTIKPLQPAGVNGENWPEEYLINEELYNKYGPIVKVVQYENAYTPTQLMTYAQTEMEKMKGEESFEMSALDLKACGLQNCDALRLMQKIKINDDPHGIEASIVLTKMSLDLADMSKNTYTLGYEANRGISKT